VDETILIHVGLAASGIAAGFINTMAGGGSMLTLPMVMLLGYPANDANGTIRLSVLTQSIAGVLGFRRGGALDEGAIVKVLAPTILGSLIGAIFASQLPPQALKIALLSTMMGMATLTLVRPAIVFAEKGSEALWSQRRLGGTAALFGAGLYGGFVQAGVGFVLLACLGGVLRYDLVRANALKLVCTTVFGAVAITVFAIAGQVVWLPAALLAVYTVIGSLIGVRFALRVRQGVLRWILFVAVFAACVGAFLRS
jgi:uncharacterized membrane protein YfcA